MEIKGDMHTHTLVSEHAFSTVKENIDASLEKGFDFICITDHGPETLDGARAVHFNCIAEMPEYIKGLRFYKGAEVNIKNFEGRIDLSNNTLKRLDFVIASYHSDAIEPGSKEDHTRGWLNVIKKKYVDCLGHMGNPKYDFDHKVVMRALKESGKIFEINAHSPIARKGSEENCIDLINLAKEYEIPVIATSDAHHCYSVGEVEYSLRLLERLNFPEELVLNTSLDKIDAYIERRRKEKAEGRCE